MPTYKWYIMNGEKKIIYDTLFLLPVSARKKPYLANIMVMFRDLVERTFNDMFEVGLAMFKQGKMPFRLWDLKGPQMIDPSPFNSVFYLDPSSGSNEARDLGSVSKMWKAASGKRISKPRNLSLSGNLDFATVQQAVINAARTSDHQQYQNFINGRADLIS